ncbi:hypothetical protein BYT27DRAFT_7249146 [Phlegmacium glaucopus]|nr:hypothetical protein BYT27DRAFT_7249146 [Phlegmacium glaucopus]
MAPHTLSKAFGAAFQNINIAPQQCTPPASQYQPQRNQPAACTPFSTFVERPAHKWLTNVLSKALPIQPNNPEGLATYNNQVQPWLHLANAGHVDIIHTTRDRVPNQWSQLLKQTAATNVNMVALESDKIQMYNADELAHLQQLANQEKVDGPSV